MRTGLLAAIATIEAAAHGGGRTRRQGATVLDGQIGEAAAGVETRVGAECACGAGGQTGATGATPVGDGAVVHVGGERHDQFGQKHPIPKNGGKVIEFRQYDPLPEQTTPLVEGVTPDGQSLTVKTITSEVKQYGGYVTLSDMLMMTAIDNNLVQATKLTASQAGRTLDTITREIINAGTVVQFSQGQVDSRDELYYTSEDDNCNLTVDAIKRAVRFLETQDAPQINGYYVGIIHPYSKYDLMKDPDWKTPHEYVDTENVYQNEIGELYGVRFVQSSRAKVFAGADLASDSRTLAVNGSSVSATTTVPFDGGTVGGRPWSSGHRLRSVPRPCDMAY